MTSTKQTTHPQEESKEIGARNVVTQPPLLDSRDSEHNDMLEQMRLKEKQRKQRQEEMDILLA